MYFFFFLLLRTVENCPYEMKKGKDIFNLPFLSPESSLGENSDASRDEIWQRPLLKVMTHTGFPCSLFLGHCLLKLALFCYLGLSVSFFILKYSTEIHKNLFLKRTV